MHSFSAPRTLYTLQNGTGKNISRAWRTENTTRESGGGGGDSKKWAYNQSPPADCRASQRNGKCGCQKREREMSGDRFERCSVLPKTGAPFNSTLVALVAVCSPAARGPVSLLVTQPQRHRSCSARRQQQTTPAAGAPRMALQAQHYGRLISSVS